MDILEEKSEFEPEEVPSDEEIEEIPKVIDPDKLLEDEVQQLLSKKSVKPPHHTCSRCKNDLGAVDQWFNFGVKLVKFGYTMIPQPLCKTCFYELESWLQEFDEKEITN